MTTFTEQRHEGHPTEIAKLMGSRLAVAQETEEGRAWAEAKLKQLTGGDKLTARFMHRDFFDFEPTFKVLIAGNHKPSLRNVQKAERRRFHIIPFTATIPDSERDPDLLDKLRSEAGAILRWALDGTAEWRRTGLAPPKRVRDATEAYFTAEDSFGEWLTDNFDLRIEDPSAWEPSGVVWGRWVERCKADGEDPGSRKDLSKKLEQRGLGVGEKVAGQRAVKGLRLRLGASE
jgi:P4 family phage/plasmid primase-like protien